MATYSARPQVMMLSTSQALAYVNAVKDTFRNEMEKYDDFLAIMKDFKAQRIDAAGVAAELKELFEGHPNLILGLNIFLPKEHEITLPSEDEQHQHSAHPSVATSGGRKPVTVEEAFAFLMTVKNTFRHEMEKYKYEDFLEIMRDFKAQRIGTADVAAEVKELFKGHRDLILGFNTFLPKDYLIEDEQPWLNKLVVALSKL